MTSLVSTVEVAFAASEGMTKTLSPDVDTKIGDLWAPGGPIRTVELYPLVATRARNLIREGVPRGWSGLRANDAIDLATARQMEVAEFHTYDGQLNRYEDVLGFPICEPRSDQARIV